MVGSATKIAKAQTGGQSVRGGEAISLQGGLGRPS